MTMPMGEVMPQSLSAELFSHCRRTAALAQELAAELHIDSRLLPVLEHAALLHHSPEGDTGLPACAAQAGRPVSPGPPPAVQEVLRNLRGHAADGGDRAYSTLSHIVKTCDLLDQRMEAAADGQPGTIDEILNELWEEVGRGRLGSEAVAALQVCSANILSELAEVPSRMTVNPVVAEQVRSLLLVKRDCDPSELESIAKNDPVLAASVIRIANSAIYNPSMRISRLAVAISFVGTEVVRNTLIAAVLRPLFVSAGLRRLWNHCLQTAQFCEALAVASGLLHPEEGFLLGLVHDIGRLAIQHLPRLLTGRYSRLVENGCPPAYAELVAFHCEHGQIGEAVLSAWGFPAHITEAVRNHHRPEQSPANNASLLYLAEWGLSAGEDLPSDARLRCSLERTGLSPDTLKALAFAGRPLAPLLATRL